MTTDLFVPPAAEGLPLAALDSATKGAARLDAAALTPTGRNFLAHALVQLARDGWLRTEPGSGFEPTRDRATPEPDEQPRPATDRAGLRDRIADMVVPLLLDTLPKAIARARGYEIADAVLSVLPPDGRAAVLREAADALDADMERFFREWPDEPRSSPYALGRKDAATELRRLAAGERDEQQAQQGDGTILAELQQHLTDHTPSCNARTDHLMRRAAWALGAPRPEHVGGNAEKCPGCEGTNPPYPFICPQPVPAAAPVAGQPPADTGEEADSVPPACQGFQWIGQSFATCDRCGQPAWDHDGEDVAAEGAGPFSNERTVRPWKPGEADAIRAKWAPTAVAVPETVHGCPPDGSSLTPCCGRPPIELPLTDRISSEVPVTCKEA